MINFQSGNTPSAKEINAALYDFGLHHPLPIGKRMYAEYKNHGRYWYPGSAADQPDEFWEDISTFEWLALWVEHVKPLASVHAKQDKKDVIEKLKQGGTL